MLGVEVFFGHGDVGRVEGVLGASQTGSRECSGDRSIDFSGWLVELHDGI
jgi:hypothetical protein